VEIKEIQMKWTFALALLVLPFATRSFAADIRGQVATAEGVPVCALVLASGRSMFSCNPIGEYSLTDLPLEPDGSVNLQVYADGFLPFYRTLTVFGDQSVVMTRAGSCPVDSDGLSNRNPLDGTYTLTRASVFFNDSSIADTASGELSVEGTMTIMGNAVTQVFTITINGDVTNYAASAQMEDFGYYLQLQEEGFPIPTFAVLVERGDKVVTDINANAVGGDYSEVDHWVKVAGATPAIQAMSVADQPFVVASGRPGSLLGDVLNAQGMRPALLDKEAR